MSHVPQPDREMRQQILQAAQDLFLTRGYKAVSMKDIAEVVHLTSAGLYYHFPQGKAEVLLEMLKGMLTQITDDLRATIALGGPFPTQLERIVQIFLAHPFDRLQLIMRDMHTLLPATTERSAFRDAMADLERQVGDLFQQASEAGTIRADIPSAYLARFFAGMMVATMRPAEFSPNEAPIPRAIVAKILVETLLHGIEPHP